MMKVLDFIVRSNESLNYQNNLIKVAPIDNEPLPEMLPGQFVQVLVDNSNAIFLRRPISINFVARERNEIWLLVQRVGEGTRKICESAVGQKLNLVFPLGNSFTIPQRAGSYLLVGGGVGTAPLLFLGKKLSEKGFIPQFLLVAVPAEIFFKLRNLRRWESVACTTKMDHWGKKGM